jgi:hypothetical protein
VYAAEALRATGGAGLKLEAYHRLVHLATGSKAQAEQATRARMAEMLRRGQQPE